jgi:tRNA 5-methylaminomethyl-2-thiouridine biosynthesis bifunctional protein
VIGGGLAGTTTAYALAKRGIAVTLLERHQALASEASGNAQGMLYTKLSHQDSTLNRFAMSSFLYALRYYPALVQRGVLPATAMAQCGLLQLAVKEKEQTALGKIADAFASHPAFAQVVDAARASELAGLPCQHPGYWLPQSGWVSPPQLCQALANSCGITTQLATEALTLTAIKDGWQLDYADGQLQADMVVVANSHDASQFAQSAELPLKIIRGQVSQMAADALAHQPNTVICHEGYLTPPIDGQLRFGATFDNGDSSKAVRSEDHQRNLDSLQKALPALFKQRDTACDALTGRANLRCSTPDYLPMVGALPKRDAFIAQYAPLAKDASKAIASAGSYYPGLYLNVGHGSRGLTSTPLCAEYIAALACHSMRPLPRQLGHALHPARFLLRDIIRGKIAP